MVRLAANAVTAAARPLASRRVRERLGSGLSLGFVTAYLSVIVALPIAALVWASTQDGAQSFWDAVSSRQAVDALRFSLLISLGVAAINAVMGTLIAWVLVRDDFRGKSVVNAIIDLPFALPTIVAGLVIMALYGPRTPLEVSIGSFHFDADITFTRTAIYVALLFVTLPFVVRAVQPVLLELDTEVEEAAASLGAGSIAIFRRIVFPSLLPAILSGVALAFARAVGEFGAVVLISGNIPFKTEVSSVYIFGQLQSGNGTGAAAVSVVLLAISLGVLLLFGVFRRWWTKHEYV